MALAQSSAETVSFGIDDPIVPVQIWNGGTVNRFQLDGALTIGGVPVAGAVLKANQYTLPQPTGDDGSFSVRRDQTVVDRTLLTIADLSEATADGKPLTNAQKSALSAAEFAIETAFTIALTGNLTLTKGQKNAVIEGVALFGDGSTPIPPVALWGYTLSGTIVDTNGKPLPHVYASVSDDEGETWAVSNETGDDGRYQLRFFPQGDAATFTVRVAYGNEVAASESEITFASEASTELDLVLDESMGMVMGTGANGAFEQTTVPGAEYVGYLVGLAVGETPVESTITWPDDTGAFSVTIPSVDFTEPASFFQERVRFFSKHENVPGSDVEPEIVPKTLDARTPRMIPPQLTPKS
jgi:hypothetical protein